MKKTFGKHLVVDAYGIKEKKLKDSKSLKKLLKILPKKFKMRILGEPVVRKIASDFYPDWGLSGFVLLYESHISFHTWPEEGYAAMDIYSCKDFDEKAIIKYLQNYWGIRKMNTQMIKRGAD